MILAHLKFTNSMTQLTLDIGQQKVSMIKLSHIVLNNDHKPVISEKEKAKFVLD